VPLVGRRVGRGPAVRISVAVGLLACTAFSGCGSTPTPSSTAPAERPQAAATSDPTASAAAIDDSAAGGLLPLSRRGEPIVWLRRGTTIPIRDAPGGEIVSELPDRTAFGSPTVLAVFRQRGRWAGVPTPLLPNGRLGWVKLDASRLRAGWTRYSIHVDLSRRVALLRLGDRVLRSFKVTVGAPSSPSPIGRFAVTDTFRAGLDPAYGCCAVATTATQPNLPSGWLGGNRVAIHGTSGPLDLAESHGCIRAADSEVRALVNRVVLGSPVVIHG
jgi:hypothetical protein